MDKRSKERGRPGRLVAGALLMAAAVLALGAGRAAAEPADAAPQSERLAAALRSNPVYVTDQLPRRVPRSTAPRFAALARHTGVPTYVLVLPEQGSRADTLLGTVHDRLGRDGLYVLVGPLGVANARAFGVAAPAEDAFTIALYGLPYDAGPLRSFQEFTDAVASGPDKAAARAAQLRKRYGGTNREVADFYLDSTGRADQSFLTGLVLAGVPLTVLLLGWYAVRRRARALAGADGPGGWNGKGGRAGRGGKAGKGGKDEGEKSGGGGAGRRSGPAGAAVLGVTAVLALAIGAGAPRLFDQSLDSPAPRPTQADLTARVDRVAAGLARASVYTDPESPQQLDAATLAGLDRRIAAFTPGPIRIAVVPQLTDDESAGDTEAFVTALHRRLGEDGVYVVADPLGGTIDVYVYGLRLDAGYGTLLPAAIGYDQTYQADDHRLGARLDQLMTYLVKVPRTTSAAEGPDEPAPALDDHRLPGLYHGDFWPGLVMGALGAALLLALTAGTRGSVAAIRRRRAAVPGRRAAPRAPSRPSAGYLARAARREVDALAAGFAAADPSAATRARVWEYLDAAVLLTADNASPADRTAAIVLARAGQAALDGHPYNHCCAVNPLHGRAEKAPAQLRKGAGAAPDRRRLCAACRATAVHPLTLPARSGPRVPYQDAPGPLPAVGDGLDRLIERTREYASVQ
ncbi:hypothetical protein [Actinacidiphila sp. ITFR-21]|uniref:hypothetical protein n=1 Tax=Actinacidiphila sp. ITFR-21 TaxID=3075199 RepID=UPI00288B1F8E|nr:hypothetical protein [Streptomyces sp. ITFR-21]WNI17976.1 hypothetical protein RLT57_22140 [Streptomyces sp. ITFR-21]